MEVRVRFLDAQTGETDEVRCRFAGKIREADAVADAASRAGLAPGAAGLVSRLVEGFDIEPSSNFSAK